ncbi:MAG: ArsR family transcriptional regulator [Methanoregula sp.]|nr:ArsR family transcriptional regulator [Methanoregula sp.]
MNSPPQYRIAFIAVLFLLCILPSVQAASDPDYSTTYTITVADDGSAHWKIEYRTLLLTDEDMEAFENYSSNLNDIYLPDLRDLMQRSVVQAALGTSRDMAVNDFTGNALIQTSPTGKYGVITYTFVWTKFAKTGDGLSVGDAFVGGMYLARGNTLVIQYPQGYTVSSVNPAADQTTNGLTWYGLRSFGPGQPGITLKGTGFPFLPVIAGGAILLILAITCMIFYRRKRAIQKQEDALEPDETEESAPSLSKADLETLEEKIIQLLVIHNGEQFQSEIVKVLGLPKSTVSSTLNDLHQRGIIQKVRKGRENLIRLVKDQV